MVEVLVAPSESRRYFIQQRINLGAKLIMKNKPQESRNTYFLEVYFNKLISPSLSLKCAT